MATRLTRAILAGAVGATLALIASSCAQTTLAVETGRETQGGYVLVPSDTPSSREWRHLPPPNTPESELDTLGTPGGKRVFTRWCASCHGADGRGNPAASPPVPDLVTFGAEIAEPFVYNEAELPTDSKERAKRLAQITPQHTALQEGRGPYQSQGKSAHTPLRWFNSISGDPGRMKNQDGQAIQAHLQAPFNQSHANVSRQMRWDAVYYLWSLSEDVQVVTDGGSHFQVNCNVCHGRVGLGDGPLHHGLEPQPRAFNNFSWMSDKSNQRLFDSISRGRIYTAMPPWEHHLTPDQRWRIIEYLRTVHSYQYQSDYVVKSE